MSDKWEYLSLETSAKAFLYKAITTGAIATSSLLPTYSPSRPLPSENLKSPYIQMEEQYIKGLQDKVTDHETRLVKLETKTEEKLSHIEKLLNDLKQDIRAIRDELKQDINAIREETKAIREETKEIPALKKSVSILERVILWILAGTIIVFFVKSVLTYLSHSY